MAILIEDHQVSEVPGDTLRDDPLQGQASSVIHMGIWDDGGQLFTKLHHSLQDVEEKDSFDEEENTGDKQTHVAQKMLRLKDTVFAVWEF